MNERDLSGKRVYKAAIEYAMSILTLLEHNGPEYVYERSMVITTLVHNYYQIYICAHSH